MSHNVSSPIIQHRQDTYELAESLRGIDVYNWIIECGYFPEQYVLPPCFRVVERPTRRKVYFAVPKNGKKYTVPCAAWTDVHFPKSELTDRTFAIIHPEIHNDIAYHISRNWKKLVDVMMPKDSCVTSYSFPIPIDKKHPGRLGRLRSGRSIYEFLAMTDDDLTSVAYRFSFLVRADIKSFYPSIYTHSIAWAIHGKTKIRNGGKRYDFRLLGNRLDKLFQNANDGCTNGIAIGPVVSDVIAELIAAQVDRELTKQLRVANIECEAVRFKDDYQILVSTEAEARTVIKCLQAALKGYNLELNDEKTSVNKLPNGLFRPWVSKYHAVHPYKRRHYSWKQFRELYLAVIDIDQTCPNTGVIDRFLSDIISRKGYLKVKVRTNNLEKVISMLIMLATRRVKSFPKVIAIIEAILRSPFGESQRDNISSFLGQYLKKLSADEGRNKYLISWISYFLISNDLKSSLDFKPHYQDPITRSVFYNRGNIFTDSKEFKLFIGCKKVSKRITMLEHLEIFNPPK